MTAAKRNLNTKKAVRDMDDPFMEVNREYFEGIMNAAKAADARDCVLEWLEGTSDKEAAAFLTAAAKARKMNVMPMEPNDPLGKELLAQGDWAGMETIGAEPIPEPEPEPRRQGLAPRREMAHSYAGAGHDAPKGLSELEKFGMIMGAIVVLCALAAT